MMMEDEEHIEGVTRSDESKVAEEVYEKVRAATEKAAAAAGAAKKKQQQRRTFPKSPPKPTAAPEEATPEDESEREYLVRTGMVTPFANVKGLERKNATDRDGVGHLSGEGAAEDVAQTPHLGKGAWLDDGKDKVYWKRMAALRKAKRQAGQPSPKRTRSETPMETETDAGDEVTDDVEAIGEVLFDAASVDDDEVVEGVESEQTEQQRDTAEQPPHVEFEGGLQVPSSIYNRLYLYQQVGVRWLWELHCQDVGGILGDEMGLGKTVIIISFIASLWESRKIDRPVLIACPATVMSQWVQEFHTWWPAMRVIIAHDTGTAGDQATSFITNRSRFDRLSGETPAVMVTTYDTIRNNQDAVVSMPWSYVILDEGHKIRNPDAAVTLAFKRFQTPHRIVMSGTPIQNNLTELWSLFDFVFPGKLGTLPVFQEHFSDPISRGGYVNASEFQAQTAFKCAAALKDTISPYLLRRLKKDVLPQLPQKTEEVLLCKLTDEQRDMYKSFLTSPEMRLVHGGKKNLLYAVDILRKICNHPDLVLHPQSVSSGRDWVCDLVRKQDSGIAGDELTRSLRARSGKLGVVQQLLESWRGAAKHKALLFCQTRQMLNILEPFVAALGHSYLRMDGTTALKDRMAMIERFNTSPDAFLFLLTTKVGGIGLNLTGADRVILFDPDWNPSTDEQARERALRIGQGKTVKIFRLVTAGTIEEKVYHRQLFKSFLKNRVLKDPLQKRLFRESFLKELFFFSPLDGDSPVPETAAIFQDAHPAEISAEDGKGGGSDGDGEDDGGAAGEGDGKRKNEAEMLRKMIDGEEIASAISHDAIVDGNTEHERERRDLEYEAGKIARRSIEALRKSREACSSMPVTQPTWTGRKGLAGAPQRLVTKRFGVVRSDSTPGRSASSSAMLEDIASTSSSAVPVGAMVRRRTSVSPPPADDLMVFETVKLRAPKPQPRPQSPQQQPPLSAEVTADTLARELVAFLESMPDCEATSEAIVDHFNVIMASTSDTTAPYVLKQLLRKVATFDPAVHAWSLKPSWRRR